MAQIDTDRLYAIIADKEAIIRALWYENLNLDEAKYIFSESEIAEIESRLACLEGMRQAIKDAYSQS